LRTAKVFALLCVAQLVLALPGLRWPGYLDTPIGLLLVAPYFTAYIAHALGMPGLLEKGGACGWGWCAPSGLGWLVIGASWWAAWWGIASMVSRLLRKEVDDSPPHP